MPAVLSSLFTRIPFWVQILAGLVLGVALGLVARSGDVAWLATTLDHRRRAVRPAAQAGRTAAGLHRRRRQHRQPARRHQRRPAGRPDAAVVHGHLAARRRRRPRPRPADQPGPGRHARHRRGCRRPKHVGTWTDFLTGIIPTNPVGAFVDGNVLQIVFLGAVVGAAALQLGAKAEPFLALNTSVLELVQKALWWVIRLAPLGTLGLIGKAVAAVRLGPARAARDVHRRRLRRLRHRARSCVYPRCCVVVRPAQPAAVLRRRLAGDPARVRLPLLGRHDAADPAGHRRAARRAHGVRLLRGAVRRHHQDGRLRRDLPGARGDLRRPGLRRAARRQGLPAHRVRLGGRLRGHRRPDRRHRHADADAQHAGPAAGRRRAAAGHRPDPGHDAHRDQRGRPGPGARPGRAAARASWTWPCTTRPRATCPPAASSAPSACPSRSSSARPPDHRPVHPARPRPRRTEKEACPL